MKSFALTILAVLSFSSHAHNARIIPDNYWGQVYAEIIDQVSKPEPYSTSAWAPLLRQIASRPVPTAELESAVRDYVYRKFAEQGVRLSAGETLFMGLEKLFTAVPIEEPSLEALRAMGWASAEEYREFEKRRILVGGRDMVPTYTVAAEKLSDVRGLALALEIMKPGAYLRPEVRRFLTNADVEYLAQARDQICSWRLAEQ